MADNRLRGKISGRAGMRGNLNSAYIPIYYNGVKTDTIEVIVDNIEKTIKANLIKGMTDEGAVRFDMVQGLTNAERERARRNIGAVEANPSIPSPSQYLLVRYDNKGLVTSSRRIEKDDLPKELNGHIFLDDVTLQKDLRLNGNLYQNGASYELHATKVLTKNDYIFMRDGAVSGLADDEYTGLIANDYNGKGDYGALIYDKKGVARVGDVTFKFESMSTKPETLEKAYGYFYHDDETNKFRVIDGTFTEEQYAKLERVYREKVITNETQAIATRLEEGDANLVDNKLVIWDAENHILTAPNFQYEQTNDTSEPSADDGEISYISDIQVDQNGRVSSTNIRKSTIKKSWRPVKVNGEEFLIATDGKTINFKDGSSIVLTKVNDNAELTISINNKANEDDKNENDTDSEAFQFLNYNTEGLITSKKATARRKAIKLSTASSELLLSTVYGTDNKDLILYGPKRQITESEEKRYLLGSARTDDMADTDTNHLAYMQNGILYSNNSVVLNRADTHVITGDFYFQNGLSISPDKSIHFHSYYGTEKSKLDIDAEGNLTFNGDLTLLKNRIKTSSGYYLNYSDEEAHIASTDTEQEITGKKTFGSQIIGNAGANITGDLTVKGNIYQTGTTYETHAEKVYSKKDYIYLREGASSALADGNFSGIEFIKYDGTNNGRLVVDKNGVARVGDVGDERPLATREETPLENGYAKWDNTNSRFKTINLETLRSEVGTSTTANTDKLLFNTYTKNGFINGIVKQVYSKKLTINGVDRNIITDVDSDLAPIYAAEVAGATDGEILQWDSKTGKPKWAASASAVTVYDKLDQAVHMEGRALSAHQGYVLDNKKVDREFKYTPQGGLETTYRISNGDYESQLGEGKMLGMLATNATFDSAGEITGGGHTIFEIGTKLGVLLTQNSTGNMAQVETSLDSGIQVKLDAIDVVNDKYVNIALDGTSNAIILNTTSSQLVISQNVLTPSGNGNFDLGSASSRYKDLYLAGNLSDGTKEISVADIANVSQVPQVEDIRNIS